LVLGAFVAFVALAFVAFEALAFVDFGAFVDLGALVFFVLPVLPVVDASVVESVEACLFTLLMSATLSSTPKKKNYIINKRNPKS